MVTNTLVADFVSRDCKSNLHQNCHGKWKGLGFEVICKCQCHNKKEMTLELFGVTNAIREIPSSSKEIQRL
jgi:hypothetical protein